MLKTSFVLMVLMSLSAQAARFPNLRATHDQGDILDDYPAYLTFVLEIGRQVDISTAKRLETTYSNLRKRSPQGAARFLKGLRFELVQKLEFMGLPPSDASTSNQTLRRWVAKWQREWLREADEHYFRSFTPVARK